MLDYETRKRLKQRVSEIQAAKEERARRLWVFGPSRKKIYMGGGSRPSHQQILAGYPNWHQIGRDEDGG